MDNDLRNNGGGWEKKQRVSSALVEWRVSRLAGGTGTVELIKQAGFESRGWSVWALYDYAA